MVIGLCSFKFTRDEFSKIYWDWQNEEFIDVGICYWEFYQSFYPQSLSSSFLRLFNPL